MILTLSNYAKLPQDKKKEYLEQALQEESVSSLAAKMGTYTNKIRREAQRLDIEIRNRSETRKMLLENNKAKSPTEGKKRSKEEKIKIGKGRSKAWTPKAKKKMAEISKERWEQKTDDEKAEFLESSRAAIREALLNGSKLEQEIYNFLIDAGYNAERQRKFLIERDKMSIDIFLNDEGIAIEIDGPSHQLPIWGEDKLERTRIIDKRKDDLLLGANLRIIRIKFNKTTYLNDHEFIKEELVKKINSKEKYSIIEVKND